MTRFLIVDDHPLFSEALQTAIRQVHVDSDIFEATSIDGALDVISAHNNFDLALLDLSLPDANGFCGLIRIRTTYPKLPVVVVSGYEDPDLIREAISLGIAGYIPKSTPRKELNFAISEVLAGSIYIPSKFLPLTSASGSETSLQSILKQQTDRA
eukprot:gene14668-14792_t